MSERSDGKAVYDDRVSFAPFMILVSEIQHRPYGSHIVN